MYNIKVKTDQREYTFENAEAWEIDELFLLVESPKGEKRFIRTRDIFDILIEDVPGGEA